VDIEGFVRRKIKYEDEITVQKTLANKILEYKDIDYGKASEMAVAVIEEVKNSLKIDLYPDESLKDLI
jgi:hydrogenase expression/formation protein